VSFDNLVSGAVGAFLALLFEEGWHFYEQKCDDLIGSIILAHQIQSNIATLTTVQGALLDVNSKMKKPTLNGDHLIEIPELKGLSDLEVTTLNLDKNLTLKYADLGCFYMISQANNFGKHFEYLVQRLHENYEYYRNNYNSSGSNIVFNNDFLQQNEKGTQVTSGTIIRIMQNYEALTELNITSLDKHFIFRVCRIKKADREKLKNILHLTRKKILAYKEQMGAIETAKEVSLKP
jgi:hypothetical protein